ncbi:MAG: hypothetical protein JNJ54_11500 [Myxococcaceae bacterium]|nr:hypothetical protein [Myxococcaceae bacterium]
MNVLRSLARELLSFTGLEGAKQSGEVGLRTALDKRVVPPVVDLGRYRDSFERYERTPNLAMKPAKSERAVSKAGWSALGLSPLTPMETASLRGTSASQAHLTDGFERGRRLPLDLSGGARPVVTALMPEKPASSGRGSNGFTASLADLL